MIKDKTVKKATQTDYAYLVGRIRALENLLLKDNEVERMMLAENPADAFKILNELDFANNKAGISNPSDFQKVLNDGLIEIKELLESLIPSNQAAYLLFLDYDFHNMKTLLKAKLGGKSLEEVSALLSPLGTINTESLAQFIFEEQNVELIASKKSDAYIKRIIKEAIDLFHKENENPEVIDLHLDQKMFKIIFNIAKDLNSPFLVKYVQKLIDLNNIKLFFRMNARNKELHLFDLAFIWNGTIPFKKFESVYEDGMSALVDALKSTEYGKLTQTGYEHYKNEKTFISLEKGAEDLLIDTIRQAKQFAFGVEPVIAYFLANKNNALAIRMIMINKLNGIDASEIQKRIRKLY